MSEGTFPRKRVQHQGGGQQMTKQSDALASDVNSIMSKYIRTGEFPRAMEKPRFGDFRNSVDFHTAMSTLRECEAVFLRFPLAVRERCANDPGKFLDMVYDPAGRAELEKLGLAERMAPEAAPEAVAAEEQAAVEPQSESSQPEGESPHS